MKSVAVYTTVSTIEDAESLARAVVSARLAACAQLEKIESIYSWKNEIRNEPEVRIVFKTTAEKYGELEKLLTELHPYEIPAIYAVEVCCSYRPYAVWLAENTDSTSHEAGA